LEKTRLLPTDLEQLVFEYLGDQLEKESAVTLRGHSDWVYSVCLMPDGLLASASKDLTIRVWNVREQCPKCILTLTGHTDYVYSVCALADGRLASASRDGTVRIWDLADTAVRRCVQVLDGHRGKHVHSVCALPGSGLASGSADGRVCIWDTANGGGCLETHVGHPSFTSSLCNMGDRRLGSGSLFCHTIKIWDLGKQQTGGEKSVRILKGHSEVVAAVCAMPGGLMASGSLDKTVRIWNLSHEEGEECVRTLKGHSNYVSAVCSLGQSRLASVSFDNTLRIWDLRRNQGEECVQTVEAHRSLVSAICDLGDGRLASASYDNTIKIWH